MNDDNLVFLVPFSNKRCVNVKVYKHFKQAVTNEFISSFGLSIEKVVIDNNQDEEGSIGYITFNRYDNEVTDIIIYKNYNNFLKKQDSLLEEFQVELKYPYKPYDLLYKDSVFQYNVVADANHPMVKEALERNKDKKYNHWLKLDLPIWFIEPSKYANIPQGEINISLAFRSIIDMNYFELITDDNLKIWQIEMINKIKEKTK